MHGTNVAGNTSKLANTYITLTGFNQEYIFNINISIFLANNSGVGNFKAKIYLKNQIH